MSQFFTDIEVEQSDARKKPALKKETSDEEDGVSKRESKVQAIRREILQAEENLNNKSVDKVLRLLQKSSRFLIEVQPLVQKFVQEVLANKKVSQVTKSKCEAFMGKFESGKEGIQHGQDIVKRVSVGDELAAIMCLKDFDEKCMKLRSLKKRVTDDAERFKVLMSELMMLVHASEAIHLEKIRSLMLLLSELYDRSGSLHIDGVDLKKLFVQQARTNLGTLLSFINREGQPIFVDIANALRKHDQEYVDRKLLEFKYFHLNDFVENKDSNFRLLYLTKNGMYDSALQYLDMNEEYLFRSEEKPVLDSLLMLGTWAFYGKKYSLAFKLLQQCYYNNYNDCEMKLLVLCCILNHRVSQERFFKHFVEQLSVLEKNPLLLESGLLKNDIFRAFFLLMSYDHMECESILRKAEPALDCHEMLRQCVESMVEELETTSVVERPF